MPLRPIAIAFVVVCAALAILPAIGAVRGLCRRRWAYALLAILALCLVGLAALPVPYIFGLDAPPAVFNGPAPVPGTAITYYLSLSSPTSAPAPQLIALRADTGKSAWQRAMPSPDTYVTQDAGTLYAASVFIDSTQRATQLFALDGATGAIVWQRALPGTAVWRAPLPANGALLLSTAIIGSPYTEEILALRPADGQELWNAHVGEATGGDTLQLIAVPDAVYELSSYGAVTALAARTGAPLWSFGDHDSFHAAAVAGDTLYVSAQHSDTITDGAGKLVNPEAVYALDAHSGALRWTFATRSANFGHLIAGPDAIFIQADDGIHALRPADGAVLWHSPSQTSWAFSAFSPIVGPVLYVTAIQTLPPETLTLIGPSKGQEYLYAVNAADGSLYWSVPVGPVITIYPHIVI